VFDIRFLFLCAFLPLSLSLSVSLLSSLSNSLVVLSIANRDQIYDGSA